MANLSEIKLSFLSVGISLASIHFGLGFLVGSGESIYQLGSRGILYSLSSSLGVFSLMIIAGFYWRNKYPIWKLMGDKYGTFVYRIVAFLSGIWMLGVVASQILGGAWALSIFGFENRFSMVFLSFFIYLLTRINLGRLSKIFMYMLFFSSGALFLVLLTQGLQWIPISVGDFALNIKNITFSEIIGVLVTTVLVTFLGMDFQQFIVRAKNQKEAVAGSFVGGIILIGLSFLLLAIVESAFANNLIKGLTDPKQTIPIILYNFGNQYLPIVGLLFTLPIVLVSIGSGSGVSRVVIKTINDLEIFPQKFEKKIDIGLLTVLLALIIAFTGKSIIDLIVSFYAIYVGSVFIPFLLYLFDKIRKIKQINSHCVQNSIIIGFISSSAAFFLRFIPGSEQVFENHSTLIVLSGLIGSIVGFLSSCIIQKLFSGTPIEA